MDPIKLPNRQLVLVDWSDSSYAKGWHYPPYRFGHPERIIRSVGYVVSSDKRILTLTGSADQDGGALCPVFVPWHAITSLKRLKLPEAK